MLSNKDRNNKGNVKGVDEGHIKQKSEARRTRVAKKEYG